MKKALLLILIIGTVFLAGCAGVTSKYPIGLEDYKLDAQAIDGMWINNEGAVYLKVIDADKGIFRFTLLKEEQGSVKTDSVNVKIMKGNSWLYFNMLPDNNAQAGSYLWGRIVLKDNKLIMWWPLKEAFVKAVEEKKIGGTIKTSKVQDGDKTHDQSDSVLLTDEPKKIIDLIETSDKSFFQWDSPTFFIRMIK